MEPQAEPLSPWIVATTNSQFRVEPKKFVDFLAKLATAISKQDAGKGIESGWTLYEISKGNPTADERAGILIMNAMTVALFRIIQKNEFTLASFYDVMGKSFETKQETALQDYPVFLNQNFFLELHRSNFVKAIADHFERWLAYFKVAEESRKRMARSVPNEFLIALVEEWRRKPENYTPIIDELKNPFHEAAEREYYWAKYRQTLMDAFYTKPMFEEKFGLSAVYVGLRAYSTAKHKERGTVRRVVDLAKKVNEWLEAKQINDSLRVLSGGPGSGKSSFGKMLAAELAQERRYILYIPLQELSSSAIETAVGDYLMLSKDILLKHNPLATNSGDTPLVVIFDGLDELAQEGKEAADLAQSFVTNLKTYLKDNNREHLHIQAILSGREPVIQTHIDQLKDRQAEDTILHLLPYKVAEKELFSYSAMRYNDPDGRLATDQRDLWWQKYYEAKTGQKAAMPEVLKRNELEDVTREPLLNYLVALSYARSQDPKAERRIDFSTESNRNRIYADLLYSIYIRPWGEGQILPDRNITEHQFYSLMEEIAVVAWNSGGALRVTKPSNHTAIRRAAISLTLMPH